MDLLKLFQQFINKEGLFHQKDRLLVAVSGGVDSVVLCELCKRSGFDFSIAHCNFQLREGESKADEHFVQGLSVKYGVPYFVKRFDTKNYAAENKLGIQEAARNLRYEWFAQLLCPGAGNQLNVLLTAHHANDNIETLLMNFFKGTGITGLQGIQAKSGQGNHLVRPLLFAKKSDLTRFATENNLAYREDASNLDTKYTRNYFRNELIPALEKVYPRVQDNLLDNLVRFKDIDILYRNSMEAIKKKLLHVRGTEIHIPVLKLGKMAALSTLIFEVTKPYGFTSNQVTAITGLLSSDSGKYVESESHRILRNRNWLIISALNDAGALHYLIGEPGHRLQFPAGALLAEQVGPAATIPKARDIALLDASAISFPLLLRKWKQGDYFYPLGMKHKKKLSRFFIDQKLSLNEKENTWVIEMNKKIIWVVGHRIDERFRVTEQSASRLKLTFFKQEN